MARPKKSDLATVKNKNKGVIGRPKGDKALMDEYKARMLNSPKSAKVLEAIYNAALDDNHKAQSAAWKLIVDRIIPVSMFEQSKAGGGVPQISINITGLNSSVVESSDIIEQDDSGIIDVEPKEF